MCLSKLDEKTKEVTEGWKVFTKDLEPQFTSDRLSDKRSGKNKEAYILEFPMNTWIEDT
ncbi:hypothetical protein LCGC14_1987350, partial [marine sediment metagenome]